MVHVASEVEFYGVGESRQFLEVAFFLGLVVLVDGVVQVCDVGLVVFFVVELELGLADDWLEIAVAVFEFGEGGFLEGFGVAETGHKTVGNPADIHDDMFLILNISRNLMPL